VTRTDHRLAFYRSYALAADIAAGVGPDQLSRPTPCAQYDVAALVDHLVGAGFRAAALGRGEQPTGEAFPHVELADAPDELRRAAKEAETAWADDAALDATITMPWGEEYRGSTLVDMYLTEMAAHSWDLAVATGQVDRLDPELPGTALQAARAMLKPEYRNLAEEGSPYGSEVQPPADADDWERLAAFTGRRPR